MTECVYWAPSIQTEGSVRQLQRKAKQAQRHTKLACLCSGAHCLLIHPHFSLSQQSSPSMHSLVHQHQQLHQHAHRHAFTPFLHRSSTTLPAPPVMAAQSTNFSVRLPRGTARPSFAPYPTHKSFRSPKGGRWSSLHVGIAWKIYYHKQIKKMQPKLNNFRGELTPEYPSGLSLPESEDSSCGHFGIWSERGKKAENISYFNRSHPSDFCTSSAASYHNYTTTQRDKPQPPTNLHWKPDEKEQHRVHKGDMTAGLALRDKSRDRPVSAELDVSHGSSLDRKRQVEYNTFFETKRMKKEVVDDEFDSPKTFHADPSSISTTHTHPTSHIIPVQYINESDLSVLFPNSQFNVSTNPGGLVSFQGPTIGPYKISSSGDVHNTNNLHSRHNVLRDYSLNTCKAQRHKEVSCGFFAPPVYFPLGLRLQETAYLGGREFLRSRHDNCHLPHCRTQLHHPGFLATSCLGPSL